MKLNSRSNKPVIARHTIVAGLLFLLLITGSCADLSHINTFSKVAVESLSTYNTIDYSFTESYNRYTLTAKIYDFSAQELDKNQIKLPVLQIDSGQLQLAKNADKVIMLYITGISAYFQGISKLTDKDLVNYQFDTLASNLKGNASLKTYLGIKNDKQVDAITNISSIFTNGVIGGYRKSKVRTIMIRYNDDVCTSLQTLIDILNLGLLNNLNSDYGLVDSRYQLVLANPKVDLGAKLGLIKAHTQEVNDLDKIKAQLLGLIEALKKIRDEHQKVVLALKNNKITSDEVKTLVNNYAGQVYQIYTTIKSSK